MHNVSRPSSDKRRAFAECYETKQNATQAMLGWRCEPQISGQGCLTLYLTIEPVDLGSSGEKMTKAVDTFSHELR